MEKNKIKLTESKLKKVIKEAVKNILNEIGDTADGKMLLGKLITKADKEGRNTQSRQMNAYLKGKTPPEVTYLDAGKITYKVINTRREIYATITNDGNVTLNGIDSTYINIKQSHDISELQWITTSRNAARLIVKWIQTYCPEADKMYLDWHTWAAL